MSFSCTLVMVHTTTYVQCVLECVRTPVCVLPYSLDECGLDVCEAQVLGDVFKYTSKLHTIKYVHK